MSITSFKHKLQDWISLDDREWKYTVPNLPAPQKLDNARLIKTVSLIMKGDKQEIVLTLVRSEDNRATRSDPLHQFLVVSVSEFRPPPRRSSAPSSGTPAASKSLQPSTPRECVDYTIRLLRAGIALQGVHYNFYGHSNSQLKSRTVFLYAAPKDIIARKVDSLGDFSTMKTVGKKAKRIGLLFSTAQVAMHVDPDRVEDIPDIESADYVYTDGCGLISPRLASELARRVRIVFRDKRYTPSVFQIRYRGYKGVVTVDPTMLRGDPKVLLKMRSSMRKFKGGDDHSFSVVEYSKPYTYGYLNDEVVVLLRALGIESKMFARKQEEHFQFLAEAKKDPGAAFRFLSYVNETALAERVLMDEEEKWASGEVQKRIGKLVKAEYAKMLNKRDEQKCRILIPKSRLLFGVCDAWGVLKEGECAVKVTLVGDGQPASLTGMEVLVTRNPCLHPGDMQKFKAVQKPELDHLVDCIVFSTKGRRPAADLMSGGDLDGDTFFVCWDSDVIPSTISQPAQYPGVKEPLRFTPITDDDRLVYFARYTNASLGRVKNLYLDWARARGPMAPECQELNRLFSQCVDGNRIKVPNKLEKAPPPPPDAPPFILDYLHDEAKGLILMNTRHASRDYLDGYDFDAMQLLLNRDDVGMSEFELICMTLRWCRKNNARLEHFLDYFDLNVLTAQEKAWVLQQIPPSAEIPALVMNAVSYSSLITEDAARRFHLSHHAFHWKCIYDSSSRDRIGTFLDAASKSMEVFHRKLIILQVDERLTVAIYIPRKIEPSQDCIVNDSVRLFAFPHTQGTETQSRMTLPTKMTYRLYCDERTFQLFEGQRGNTWIFINRGPSDDSSYRAAETVRDRRKQRQATLDDGTNFDFRASIALDKFSRNLQRHVGRVNRNGVSAAEIYAISNRDVKSMRNLDLWLEHVDSDTVLPLFDEEVADYTIPSIKDVDWSVEPDFIADVVCRGRLAALRELRSTDQFHQLFSWIRERDQTPLLFQCFDYLLSTVSSRDLNKVTRLGPDETLRTMLGFLQHAPVLAICFGRMAPIDVVDEMSESLATTIEVHAFEVLRAYILSANTTRELVVAPLKSYLAHIRGLTLHQFVDLVELLSLTVRQPEIAMDILLECLEAESTRLLSGRPAVVQHLVRNIITIALDHIDEASEQPKARKDLLQLKLLEDERDGYQVVEVVFRIDSDSSKLENAAHVRLTAASVPANSPLSKPASIDALVIHSEQGLGRFQCFHPLPPFYSRTQWKLTYCGPYTTTKTMLDAVRDFAINPGECCHLSNPILGLPVPILPSRSDQDLTAVFSSSLNPSQADAVRTSLTTPLLYLWGPPGTGKTQTIISIILSLQSNFSESRILVTAPTHNAVDNVLARYLTHSPAINPLRVSTEIRKVSPALRTYTVDAMLNGSDMHSNRSAWSAAKKRVKRSRIVFSTCIGSSLGLLRGEEFQIVIIDEASQQTEGASLVPLVKGCDRAVLVGDHVQLRPTVGMNAGAVGGDVSLFERGFTEGKQVNGVERRMLDTQYRMHPDIGSFISSEFYEGKLKNGVEGKGERLVSLFGVEKRMIFVECVAREDVGGKSKCNQGQADVCLKVCKKLAGVDAKEGTKETKKEKGVMSVAVLTPYAKQVELLKKMLASVSGSAITIEVSSIDGFQGREADVVVFVTVRCNESREIGFLKDARRMNVALTRGKDAVIIIGNKLTLTGTEDEESAGLWKRVVGSCAMAVAEE
ncbi:RNA dependent RNA polymerase-domain-containing protein [Cladorrhinum sp. PSN332]|nr:RNA dependent RNA polymerase-domain-containing protein [Cladorrhinum sp. PSN332]